MLEYLYTNIKTADADMATCGIYEVYKDRIEAQEETPGFVCTGEEAFAAFCRDIPSAERYGISSSKGVYGRSAFPERKTV